MARRYDSLLSRYVGQEKLIKRIKKERTKALKKLNKKSDIPLAWTDEYDNKKTKFLKTYYDKLEARIKKKTKTPTSY